MLMVQGALAVGCLTRWPGNPGLLTPATWAQGEPGVADSRETALEKGSPVLLYSVTPLARSPQWAAQPVLSAAMHLPVSTSPRQIIAAAGEAPSPAFRAIFLETSLRKLSEYKAARISASTGP